MKFLKNILGKVKPAFEKGGKFEKIFPLYDALETFAFVPGHTTEKGSHIRDAIDLKRTMFIVIVAMIPAMLFGVYNTGYQHYMAIGVDADFWQMVLYGLGKLIPLIVVSYGVGLGIEFLFAIQRKHSIHEGFLVTGMLIPLIMPADVPLWMVALSTAFAVVFGKEVFGGTGMNIVNVALTARAFLFFAYPTEMSGNNVWVKTTGGTPVDGFTGETFLAQAVERGAQFSDITGAPYDGIGESFMQAFLGFIPGSFGETSTLAILIGAFILIWTGIGSWKIILSCVLGGAVMGLTFNIFGEMYFPENAYLQVPWWQQLVLGGFMFGAVFMATDPVTAAQTEKGKWIYGFLIGALSIIIRLVNPAYPEGVMMAILFMNVMAPTIDHYVVQGNIKNRLKRVKVSA
ncbi:MAG TPA: NADH:ubiquinone reductase (Na(+)-transporting) subunit B [Cryomorphaceae bacterium]|nr:NADH:ubiquinone reductase (Na(+)-transporting) subunit B [Cryomorphaceae bacterium]